MSAKNPTARQSAREKSAQMRQQAAAVERRRARWLYSGVGAVLVALITVVAIVVSGAAKVQSAFDERVQTFEVAAGHTTDPVDYAQSPPVGGEHNPVWLNCGIYDAPVQEENAVHSMEHAAVWITYATDLPAEQVQRLRQVADQPYVLLSPYEGLNAPVVVSAWGKQVTLTGAEDEGLTRFIRDYRQGPQTPEPGAPCTGGTDGSTTGAGMADPNA